MGTQVILQRLNFFFQNSTLEIVILMILGFPEFHSGVISADRHDPDRS